MTTIHDPRAYIRLREVTEATVDAEFPNGIPDHLLWMSSDNLEPLISTGGVKHPLLTKGQWDATVDSNFAEPFSDTYVRLVDAIDGASAGTQGDPNTIVSIFVRKMADTDAITIASTDNVQRIQGKDADTTEVTVAITCNKDDVTFENLQFKDANLTINGNGCTIRNCLFTGTAVLKIDESDCLVEGNRFDTCSVIPLVVVEGRNRIERNFFNQITAANAISLDSDGSDLLLLTIADNFFTAGTVLTDYVIQSQGTSSTDEIRGLIISGNLFGSFPKGGIDIFGDSNQITGNAFTPSGSMPTSDRCIQLNSLSSTSVDTLVMGNVFLTGNPSNRIIEYTGADGDAEGLAFTSNIITGNGGHVLCSQDVQLAHNKMAANVTVNFNSKTGIVVIGGDMTSATISSANADLVFRGVKGQDDRGDIVHGTGSIRLNDNIELDFGTGGDAEFFYDGTNLLVKPAVVGTGDMKVSGASVHIVGDNETLTLGAGLDATLLYDGTNLVVNPSVVGSGKMLFADNKKLAFGTGGDAEISYDGSDLIIKPAAVGTGDVKISGGGLHLTNNEGVVFGTSESANFVYDGNNLVCNPKLTGIGILDVLSSVRADDFLVPDNGLVQLGTGGDSRIFYDGSNLIINPDTVGTGDLKLGASLHIDADSETLALGAAQDATLLYDGTNLQVNPRAVGTGDMVVKGDVIPEADGTYDLGGLTTEWQDLFIDGVATIDELVLAVGPNLGVASDLTPRQDSAFDLGSATLRYALCFLDALDVGGDITVSGTVDGVDISARDHAESHTAVSHSDQGATGAELETLTDGSDADALHAHTNTVAEHSDTSATGTELNTLTDGSDASALHAHATVGTFTISAALATILWTDTNQSTPLGKFRLQSAADLLILGGRNSGDSAFENIMIFERVADGGKVFFENAINVDTIDERDSAAGVTVEAVLIKDGKINAPFIDYTPTTLSDWDSSADPGDVDDALDQLAARVKALEP